MAAVTMVRATIEIRAALAALAREQGRSMVDVLGDAVEAYRRQVFFDQADAQIAAMKRERPEEWAALQAEDLAWEVTLLDGLDEPAPAATSGLLVRAEGEEHVQPFR